MLGARVVSTNDSPIMTVTGLSKRFVERSAFPTRTGRQEQHAVSDVSFQLNQGEVLGIVGESGSGKTTLARMLLRLIEPTSGSVLLHGRNILTMTAQQVSTHVRPTIRMIFQEPDAVLNPGYTIGVGLARAIAMQSNAASANVGDTIAVLLQRVGLDASFANKYPDQLSGGEKRRIGICRALVTNPEIIVADEPLSGLDVVLQERVLELLKSEQQRRGFALILISHDLDRVNQVCDRVLVMHSGRIAEQTVLRRDGHALREQYRHPYSLQLQQARVDRDGLDVLASLDDIDDTPTALVGLGCSFAPWCGRRRALHDPPACWASMPPLVAVAPGHMVACHFAIEQTSNVISRQSNDVVAATT